MLLCEIDSVLAYGLWVSANLQKFLMLLGSAIFFKCLSKLECLTKLRPEQFFLAEF